MRPFYGITWNKKGDELARERERKKEREREKETPNPKHENACFLNK